MNHCTHCCVFVFVLLKPCVRACYHKLLRTRPLEALLSYSRAGRLTGLEQLRQCTPMHAQCSAAHKRAARHAPCRAAGWCSGSSMASRYQNICVSRLLSSCTAVRTTISPESMYRQVVWRLLAGPTSVVLCTAPSQATVTLTASPRALRCRPAAATASLQHGSSPGGQVGKRETCMGAGMHACLCLRGYVWLGLINSQAPLCWQQLAANGMTLGVPLRKTLQGDSPMHGCIGMCGKRPFTQSSPEMLRIESVGCFAAPDLSPALQPSPESMSPWR